MAIRERYSHTIADRHKDKKCEDAIVRQKARKQRNSKQQLAKLDAGGHIAKKERVRLGKINENTVK